MFQYPSKPLRGFAVDGSCKNAKMTHCQFQVVDLSKSNEVVYLSPMYERGTNNIAEYLGIVKAMRIIENEQLNIPIYSDSRIAINWVNNNLGCRTNFDFNEDCPEIMELIEIYEDYVSMIHKKYKRDFPKVQFWNKYHWGENVADFGRK